MQFCATASLLTVTANHAFQCTASIDCMVAGRKLALPDTIVLVFRAEARAGTYELVIAPATTRPDTWHHISSDAEKDLVDLKQAPSEHDTTLLNNCKTVSWRTVDICNVR